jgi:hypothetical protein
VLSGASGSGAAPASGSERVLSLRNNGRMEEWNDGKTLLRVASLNIKEFWKDRRMEIKRGILETWKTMRKLP